MTILSVILVSLGLLALGYIFYGRFLSRYFGLDPKACTPAVEMEDGVDYVPAKAGFLMGQHFSAIAAAGPIVGPILAGIWFGWLPAMLWIIIGAIFIGGVHDFATLVASVRHKALSIGEIVKQHVGKTAFYLFLVFVWLTLVYVIIAFTDITAETFKATVSGEAFGPGVAASSVFYLVIGFAMGICLYRFRMPLWLASSIFIPLVLFVVWLGPNLPKHILDIFAAPDVKTWDVILLGYCFMAAVIPMWLLLQPRGYLGGCFLYGTILACLIGILFGGHHINYPAVNLEGFKSLLNGKPLFPLLFITIACGAISGFHAVVSSGTTSKQIQCEPDTRTVGYGAMILEGVVALLALSTVMFLLPGDETLKKDPNQIYAIGIAKYMGLVGIDPSLALSFALLAFSTFVYDTLDVCTRLGRYVLQELLGWKWKGSSLAAAFITLLVPLGFLMMTKEHAYLVAWPVFGTSNQLLASLTLLGLSVWLWQTGKNPLITLIPMVLIMVMTFWSLILLMIPGYQAVVNNAALNTQGIVVAISAVVLFVLAICVIIVTIAAVTSRVRNKA
ncbi:MAG: carbon starvation CstA family protein [Planctomycetota bacterium]